MCEGSAEVAARIAYRKVRAEREPRGRLAVAGPGRHRQHGLPERHPPLALKALEDGNEVGVVELDPVPACATLTRASPAKRARRRSAHRPDTSVATTRAPRARRISVNVPCPAPTSRTSSPRYGSISPKIHEV